MNTVYKRIWAGLLAAHATPAFTQEMLAGLPHNASLAHGNAAISVHGQDMTVQQFSSQLIANWQEFSIAEGSSVTFVQPDAGAVALNRVSGANPSQIFGQLSANGQVYLVNPNGVLVGPNARIDMQQFIASALDVADADFLDGGALSLNGSSTAPVVNLGEITAANGDAILIAQVVRNEGTITAPKGTAALAAGSRILLQPDASERLVIETTLSDDAPVADNGVTNTGLLEAAQAELAAAGGNVYELAINQTGVVRATGVTQSDGRVLLTSEGGSIRLDGELSAHDAYGAGGEVLVGGDYRGGNPRIANAKYTTVTANAHIDVAARTEQADGGRAIVWADQETDFFGSIDGRGRSGGFAEVSGKRVLNFHGHANLAALSPQGMTGTLLLDPDQAIISSDPDDQDNGLFNTSVLEGLLLDSNVIVNTSTWGSSATDTFGEIIVNAPFSWSSGNSLTLKAAGTIAINADIDAGATGSVALQAGGSFGFGPGSGASAYLAPAATLRAATLSIGQNADANPQSGTVNLPPPEDRVLGGVDFAGVVEVGTLDLLLENGGSFGVRIDNSANAIDTFATSISKGQLWEDLTLVDGDGDLVVTGNLANADFGVNLSIRTAGDLTLAPGAALASGENGTLVLAATGGSFINNAGAAALAPGLNGRYLVYSDDPATTVKGGLTGLPVYDKHFATDAPDSITQTGNRFLYALAPTLTFTADNLVRGENTPNPVLTYSVSGLVGGDSEAQAIAVVPTLNTTALPTSPAGDYPITFVPGSAQASDFGYTLDFVPGTLSIELEKILNIKADDFNRYFGNANPVFSFTPSGFVDGDDASMLAGFDVDFSTSALPTSPVGTYDIIPSGSLSLNDYDVTYQAGTLTIDPRLLSISANDQSIHYLDDDPVFTASWSGLASFDDELDVPGLNFEISSGSRAVGSYTITPTGAANPNYAISFLPGTLQVTPRPITVTASSYTRLYGSTNPFLSVSSHGQTAGHVVDLSGLEVETTALANSPVGTYAITLGGASSTNYDFTYVPGTLTINPAPATVTAGDASREYGEANPVFSATVSGLVLGETLADMVPDFTLTTPATPGTSVGHYAITPQGTPSANYDVDFEIGFLEITKAPISLLAFGQTHRFFGDANPSGYNLNIVGLKNGDSLANNAINVLPWTTATPFSSPGTYPVTFGAVSSTNYFIPPSVMVPGTLVVNPRPLTIRADSFIREYGDPNPVFTASFDNLASFHTPGTAFGALTLNSPAMPDSGVLDYGINIFNANNANYDITLVPGTLRVRPAPVTFAATDFSFIYGEGNPEAAVFANYSSGLKLADSLEDLRISVDLDGAREVGTHALNVSLGNSNYVVAGNAGSVTILPRPIVVSVWDAQRYYGDTLIEPVSRVSGSYALVDPAEEVYQIVDPTTAASDSGYYLLGAQSINPNYDVVGVDSGLLTVLPRPIALKPANTGLTFGDDFSGVDYLVGGVGLAPFHSTEDLVADTLYQQVTAGINHGFTYSYALVDESQRAQFTGSLLESLPDFGATITPGGYQTQAVIRDSMLRNYAVTNVPGVLSVVPRPVTITVDNKTGVRNSPLDFPFSATVSNLSAADEDFSHFGQLFPDAFYEVTPITYSADIQKEVLVADVPLAWGYTDEEFFAQFNPAPVALPDPVDNSGDDPPGDPPPAGGTTDVERTDGSIAAVDIPILIPANDPDPTDTARPITIVPGETVTVSSTAIVVNNPASGGAESGKLAPVDYRLIDQLFSIRASNFTNDNYVVTGLRLGTLTITPDPVEVASIAESTRLNALQEQLFNPTVVSGGIVFEQPMALGFTPETIPVVLQALNWAMSDPFLGAELEAYVELAGREILGEGYSAADYRIAFLSDLHSNVEKQAVVAGFMRDFAAALLSGRVLAATPAIQAFQAQLGGFVSAVKDSFASRIEAKYTEWQEAQRAAAEDLTTGTTTIVDTMLTGDVPYAEIMTDAMADTVESSITSLIEGVIAQQEQAEVLGNVVALAGGGAAGAATAGGITAVGGTVLAGKIFVNSTFTHGFTYMGAAGGGVAGAAFGVSVGIARGVQIAKMANLEAFMNGILEDRSAGLDNLEASYDAFGTQTNTVEQQMDEALLSMALAFMFSGNQLASVSQ